MVYIKIIKGGFYKYRSYRDKNGEVKSEYLGRATEEEYMQKQKEITEKVRRKKPKKKSILKRILGKQNVLSN